MEASYARAQKKLRQGLDKGEVTLLHEARKSIIHHYHHLDLLKPVWPKLLDVWLAELRDLREALGDVNDLDELDTLLRATSRFLEADRARRANSSGHAGTC